MTPVPLRDVFPESNDAGAGSPANAAICRRSLEGCQQASQHPSERFGACGDVFNSSEDVHSRPAIPGCAPTVGASHLLVVERGRCERSSPAGHGWPTELDRMRFSIADAIGSRSTRDRSPVLTRRGRYLELSTNGEHRSSLDLAVPRNRSLLTLPAPDVVRSAVPEKAGPVLPQPALERSSAHSVHVLTPALPRRCRKTTKPPVERFNQPADGLDDPRLHDRRRSLGRSRLMRQIMESVENVRPGLVFRPALRDRLRELGNLCREPAVIAGRVKDRQLRRVGLTLS